MSAVAAVLISVELTAGLLVSAMDLLGFNGDVAKGGGVCSVSFVWCVRLVACTGLCGMSM